DLCFGFRLESSQALRRLRIETSQRNDRPQTRSGAMPCSGVAIGGGPGGGDDGLLGADEPPPPTIGKIKGGITSPVGELPGGVPEGPGSTGRDKGASEASSGRSFIATSSGFCCASIASAKGCFGDTGPIAVSDNLFPQRVRASSVPSEISVSPLNSFSAWFVQ